MIKDLSASLVAAAAAINAKTREAFVAEQAAIQAKKIAKMPQQPAPKADPAAVSTAKKMAEAVEGTVPKTPREKELAAKHGHPKRITFGDVLKARGVKEEVERLNEVHVLDDEGETHVHVKDAKNVKELDDAVAHHLKKHHGFSHQDVEDHYHDGYYSEAPYHHEKPEKGSKPTETRTKEEHAKSVAERVAQMKKDSEMDEGWNPIKHIPKEKQTDAIKTAAKDVKRGSYADRAALLRAGGVKEEVQAVEGFMATMKKIGKKVVVTVTHGDDVDMIKDLQKKVGVPQTGVKPKAAKPVDTKPKMAHDYVKEEKEESAAHEAAEKKKPKSPWDTSGPSSIFDKEKSAFTSKKVSTGTQYSRKAVKEDIEQIDELSKSTLGSYVKKAADDADDTAMLSTHFKDQSNKSKGPNIKSVAQRILSQKYDVISQKRKAGVDKAVGRLTKEEVEELDELSKSTLGSYAKQASRDAVISRKIGADFEHQSKRAKSPGMKAASDEISQKYKVKSWKRKAGVDKAVDRLTKEEIECLDVQHEQFGAGKTLGQFSEDFSEVDVMFAEGIKRVSIDDIEMVEETTAIHPSAIHVSPGSNGKYKVHAVGKKFASGIKVGEHLTDTHLDDFSEMGGKIKMVKAPKKA